MANGHGGARRGAGRKRKQQAEHQPTALSDRINLKSTLLEQQHARAIERGKLETAGQIEARRLELFNAEN